MGRRRLDSGKRIGEGSIFLQGIKFIKKHIGSVVTTHREDFWKFWPPNPTNFFSSTAARSNENYIGEPVKTRVLISPETGPGETPMLSAKNYRDMVHLQYLLALTPVFLPICHQKHESALKCTPKLRIGHFRLRLPLVRGVAKN